MKCVILSVLAALLSTSCQSVKTEVVEPRLLSSCDNQIEIGDNLIPMIESELHIEEGTLNKFINE